MIEDFKAIRDQEERKGLENDRRTRWEIKGLTSFKIIQKYTYIPIVKKKYT